MNVTYLSIGASTLISCSFDYSLCNDNGGSLPARTKKVVYFKVYNCIFTV